MSDPTNLPNRTTPHWSLYQRDIFVGGTKTGGGQLPTFSTGAYPHPPPSDTELGIESQIHMNSKRRHDKNSRSTDGITLPRTQARLSPTGRIERLSTDTESSHECYVIPLNGIPPSNCSAIKLVLRLCLRQLELTRYIIRTGN
jgi:hypothetical protein